MRTLLYIILITGLVAVVAGCKPKSSCISSGGGTGGNGSISISPTHYGSYVDICTMYIKYGTLNAPANGIYDDSAQCAFVDTIPVATFNNLKAGLYYFYGKGYHTAFVAYVKGGANYTLCTEQHATVLLPTYTYNP